MKENKILTILLLILLATSLFPVSVYADIPDSLKTYTVYGEFNATVNAFQRLGLMMSDSNYQGLFFSVVALGILIGGLFTIGKGILSGKATAMAWAYLFGMIIAGVMVYSAFVKNTTTITVYDESLNKQIAIGGIPDGVAFVAGLANKIETGLVDIIWTSGDPRSYRENAGGLGFTIFTKAFEGGVDLSGTGNGGIYNNISIRRYIDDCLFFELTRAGSPLSINDVQINSDFLPILTQATNPAIYTVWYDETNKAGTTMTCTEAWNKLNTYLSSLTDTSLPVKAYWEERCRKVLPDITGSTGPSMDQACKDKSVALLSDLLGIAVSNSQLMRQYLISSELWNVMQDANPDLQMSTLSAQSTGAHLMGMGIQANDWIPIMRSTLFTIMLGALPFLFLLIPTPLFPRAISVTFGIFVFMTAWGVCDALAHSFAMDKAYSVFDGIQKGQIGFKSMMLTKDASVKALAAFGAARWTAMMVAGLLSSMLVKFGGSMLAHTLSGLGVQSAGSRAGMEAGTPGGWASKVSSLRHVAPTAAYANAFKYDDIARADTQKEFTGIKTGLGEIKDIGHGSIGDASSKIADANVMGKRESIAKTSQIKAAANKMFAGNVDGMLNAEQAIAQGKTAGQASQVIGDGRDPLTVGGTAGRSQGIGMEATTDNLSTVGDKGVYSTELSKKFRDDATMNVKRGLNDIAETGDIRPETLAIGSNLAQHPLGRAQLATQGIGSRIIKPGQEAENFSKYFGKHGKAIEANNLAGATAQMNMWTDENGGLHPSVVTTKQGVQTAAFNTGTKEYDLNAEQAKRITGKKGTPAGRYTTHTNPSTGEVVGIEGKGGFTASTNNVIMKHNADNGTDQIQTINPETGKAVWTSAKLGRESKDINKNTLDHRDVSRTGSEDTKGIKLSGADGLVQSDDATTVNRARDFDFRQAKGIGPENLKSEDNKELMAMAGAKYIAGVAAEKGENIGQFSIDSKGNLGWQIPGWLTKTTGIKGGIGGGAGGKQLWKNAKTHNYIAGQLMQDMDKAEIKARKAGLSNIEIGHAMQETYNKDVNVLTGKGFAAKPFRKASTPELDKAAGNTEAALDSINDLGPNTGTIVTKSKRNNASEIADRVVSGDKGTKGGKGTPQGPTSVMTR